MAVRQHAAEVPLEAFGEVAAGVLMILTNLHALDQVGDCLTVRSLEDRLVLS